jgi:hypothetical protein
MPQNDKFCPYCQTANPSIHVYCLHCGEALDHIPTTKVITPDFLDDSDITKVVPELAPLENRIKLMIGENTDQLYFRDIRRLVLGRCTTSQMGEITLDLTPYGALVHGVSREHAVIIYRLRQFYIMDVGSRNGTYLNEKFLQVNQMLALKHGDRIQLGRLRIYFYAQLEHPDSSGFPNEPLLSGQDTDNPK